jgi:FkbM family methyltransferase
MNNQGLPINMNNYLSLIKDRLDIFDIKYIVEVGSLDGGDSMFFRKHFPNANIYAIEGLPDNYNKYLKDNKEIKAFNIVICDYIGEIKFYVKNINGRHGIYDRGQQYGTKIIELPCITLDTFCVSNNIPKIDILKIDVEGATLNVLKGMKSILSKVQIMHIETETYPFFEGQSLHDEVVSFLNNHNFSLVDISKVEIQREIQRGRFQMDSVWINNHGVSIKNNIML